VLARTPAVGAEDQEKIQGSYFFLEAPKAASAIPRFFNESGFVLNENMSNLRLHGNAIEKAALKLFYFIKIRYRKNFNQKNI
jgi:hypothetical protein